MPITCPQCHALSSNDSRFCQTCGTTLADARVAAGLDLVCGHCRRSNPAGQRFCVQCGHSLDATGALAGTTAVPAMSRMPGDEDNFDPLTAPTELLDATTTSPGILDALPEPSTMPRPSALRWALPGMLLVLLLIGVWFWWSQRTPPAAVGAGTRPAPSASSPAGLVQGAAQSAAPAPPAGSAAASLPLAISAATSGATPPQAGQPAASATAPSALPGPQHGGTSPSIAPAAPAATPSISAAPSQRPAPTRSAATNRAPVVTPAPRASEPMARAAVVEAAASTPPPAASAPAAISAPPPASAASAARASVNDTCSKVGLLARGGCEQRECAQSEAADDPVCLRIKERDRQRMYNY